MKLQLDPNRFDACPQYNDWLDEQYVNEYGELNIVGFQPRPSSVLFSLSQDTYTAAFADFQTERQEELKRTLFEEFPTPIAHYFYRFENGYENDLQRLHFLRDTWEALIDVLHALAIAECRFRGFTLVHPAHFSDFLSDSVGQRLLNIERILVHARDHHLPFSTGKIVSVRTLQSISALNQSRNGFSHTAAQSEVQARMWISECYDDVMDVLDDVRALADVEVLRYLGHIDGNTLRCEQFSGHGFTKTIRPFALANDQLRDSTQYFKQGQLLICCEGSIFALRPFVYFREDASGHATKLCMFRKTRGDAPNRRIEFEIVGEAARCDEDRNAFKVELDDLRRLFGLGPD